ncbi:MAG: PAS domain S-box protein, partial [Steroidobacteraceae bacterium]|nr:PAS domain S-box protein [Deltaproteobacteria bacterium]
MSLRERLTNFQASFRCRLFSVFTLLTALLSILLGTLYVTIEIRERQEYAAGQLHLLAQQLVNSVRLPLYVENRNALRLLAEQAANSPHVHSVVIMSATGKLLADIRRAPLHSRTETIAKTLEVFSEPLATPLEAAITEATAPPAVRIGSVRMERDTSDLSREIHRLILSSLCIAVVFWLTVSYVCYLALRRVTRTFNALVHGIETMQNGDYASRISVFSNDEPGKAAHAINQLADSLRKRDEENLRLNRDLLKTNHSLESEIAERIQAEHTVRESEQSLKTLLDIMPVGVAWTDQDGKVEYLNHFFVERFGYSREEIRTEEDW